MENGMTLKAGDHRAANTAPASRIGLTTALVGGVAVAAAAGVFLWSRRDPHDVGTRDAQRRIRAAGMS
jgi:hypothetical protein